jgi:hypothetical protein
MLYWQPEIIAPVASGTGPRCDCPAWSCHTPTGHSADVYLDSSLYAMALTRVQLHLVLGENGPCSKHCKPVWVLTSCSVAASCLKAYQHHSPSMQSM